MYYADKQKQRHNDLHIVSKNKDIVDSKLS